jgi:hypothetical protein
VLLQQLFAHAGPGATGADVSDISAAVAPDPRGVQAAVQWAVGARSALQAVSHALAADLRELTNTGLSSKADATPCSSAGQSSPLPLGSAADAPQAPERSFLRAFMSLARASGHPSAALRLYASSLRPLHDWQSSASRHSHSRRRAGSPSIDAAFGLIKGRAAANSTASVISADVTAELVQLLCSHVTPAREHFELWSQFDATLASTTATAARLSVASQIADEAIEDGLSTARAQDDRSLVVAQLSSAQKLQSVLQAIQTHLAPSLTSSDGAGNVDKTSAPQHVGLPPQPFPLRVPALQRRSQAVQRLLHAPSKRFPVVLVPQHMARYLQHVARYLQAQERGSGCMPGRHEAAISTACLQAAEVLHGLLRASHVPLAPSTTQALLSAQARRLSWSAMGAVYGQLRESGELPLAMPHRLARESR